jgi:hypothetical protein
MVGKPAFRPMARLNEQQITALNKNCQAILDGFVKVPISALRFISRSLRRISSTPRAARFARLDLGPFTRPSKWMSLGEADFLTKRLVCWKG